MPPAEPILAFALWASHLATNTSLVRRKLTTGPQGIDTALGGGLDYGRVSAISAEPFGGAQELSLALLVSHLLASDGNVATVVDSTLAFDLRALHQRLTEALQGKGEARAMEVLQRLKIMKVFDFVGLTEGVGEIREGLDRETGEIDSAAASMREKETGTVRPRGTVGDSEDEGDEVFHDATPPPRPRPRPRKSSPLAQSGMSERVQSLILIDNITQLAAPLLKNNHAQGQALLTSFMRSLSHLTKTHNICTVLLNGTTTYATSKEEPPSIFSSCVLRPALSKSFTYALDVHLLVHAIPKTAEDARAVYGDGARGKKKGAVEMVSVVEVLQDRYEDRVGKWAAFVVDSDGRLRDVV